MVQMRRDSGSHRQVEQPVYLFQAIRRLTGPDRSRVRVAATAESTRSCFKTFLRSPFDWIYVGFCSKLQKDSAGLSMKTLGLNSASGPDRFVHRPKSG